MAPTDDLATVNRALERRDFPRARDAMASLLNAHPDSPQVLWTAGRFLGLLGAYGQAAVQFKRAVQGDPTLSHVEFQVAGKTLRIRDVPGSTWAADMLDEFGRGEWHSSQFTAFPGSAFDKAQPKLGRRRFTIEPKHQRILSIHNWPSLQCVRGDPADLTVNGYERDAGGLARFLFDVNVVERRWRLLRCCDDAQHAEPRGVNW